MARGTLRHQIEVAVVANRLYVSSHARERLRDRGILLWHITSGLPDGRMRTERLGDVPHPAIEVEQSLPDGTLVNVVWSFDRSEDEARLVTVHFFDRMPP